MLFPVSLFCVSTGRPVPIRSKRKTHDRLGDHGLNKSVVTPCQSMSSKARGRQTDMPKWHVAVLARTIALDADEITTA
jgi:hypothetical protein